MKLSNKKKRYKNHDAQLYCVMLFNTDTDSLFRCFNGIKIKLNDKNNIQQGVTLNADSIGNYFSARMFTVVGKGGKPTIGDHVTLGANVCIVGNVHIGNNVLVGAGAVVVKDIPSNCIVAGNPAKVIRQKEPIS